MILQILCDSMILRWGERLGDCLAHASGQALMSTEKNDCPGANYTYIYMYIYTYIFFFFHTLTIHDYSEKIYQKIHKNKIPCYL